MSSEPNGRITVSEDKLRAMFSDFKLELVREFEKFATSAALEMIDARVKILELWQAGILASGRTERRISDRALAWAALLVAAIGALAYILSR